MHRKFGQHDSDLIWESFMKQTNHKQNDQFNKLLEKDLEYIEQFLVSEGLMDGVKGAFGKVKDFATQKLLKPVIDMIVGALAKDPQVAQKVASAAEQGPDAVAQLAAAEGDPSAAQQVQAQPEGAQAESYSYQFNMNELICNALVEERLITSSHARIIQEKYFRHTINEMYGSYQQGEGCPWMPSTAIVKENKQVASQIDALQKSAPGGSKSRVFPELLKISRPFQNFVAKQAQAAGGDAVTAADPKNADLADTDLPPEAGAAGADAAGADAAGAAGAAGPDAAGAAPGSEGGTEKPPAPAPDATQGGSGIIGKIFGFLKNNKGILTGAVALGVLGLMMTNPATAAIALPALNTGLAGAGIGFVKGAAGTQGGIKDRVMGGLNQAGKTGAMAAGAGALAGAAGALAGGGEAPGADAGPEVDPQAAPPEDATATAPQEFTPPEVPETPEAPAAPEEELPYNPDQQETMFQRSGADEYHRDEFQKSLSPRERMQMRPGSRGYEQAFRRYLGNAETPI
jgi:hypothetical protein